MHKNIKINFITIKQSTQKSFKEFLLLNFLKIKLFLSPYKFIHNNQKHMKKTISLFIVIVIAFSCKQQAEEFFTVSGKISNGNGEKLFLVELTNSSIHVIDSTILNEEGTYSFKGKTDIPKFYALRTNSSNYLTLVINNLDQIVINSDIHNLWRNAEINGSEASSEILTLRHELEGNIYKLDSLANYFKSTIGTRDYYKSKDSLKLASEEIIKNHTNYSKAFVEKNSTNLAGLMALYQQIAPRRNVLTMQNDFEYFNMIDTSLMSLYPESEAVKKLHADIKEYKRQEKETDLNSTKVEIGLAAPEIMLTNPVGDTVRLSSFKGKYVLLDFWASWCSPCRAENPNLVKTYKKYHAKGFEIYQVSLDRSRDSWVNAIEKDQLEWTQVSDLKFWNSEAAKTYQIQSIPASFLIDKKGKIIAKNLRGDLLEAKLSEIFN